MKKKKAFGWLGAFAILGALAALCCRKGCCATHGGSAQTPENTAPIAPPVPPATATPQPNLDMNAWTELDPKQD